MNTPPTLIDLHFVPTANGQKITIMLEECGLPYRSIRKPHGATGPGAPNISTLNPIGRYPVIVDPTGPDGAPATVFESLAIALYLAEKSGRLLPSQGPARSASLVWAAVACTDLTPTMAAQFFLTLRAESDLGEAVAWVEAEARRFLHAIDLRLAQAEYLAGAPFSLADVLTFPLMATSVQRLEGGFGGYPNIARWFEQVAARPAVQKGMDAAR